MKLYIYNNRYGKSAINVHAITSIWAEGDKSLYYTIPGSSRMCQMDFLSKEARDLELNNIIKMMQEP